MPIKPLDLQTMFVQMNQVGKDHANIRNQVHHNQDLQAEKLIKIDQQKDQTVVEVQTEDNEAAQIHKDGQNRPGTPSNSSKKRGQSGTPQEQNDKPEPFHDPLVGSRIDLEG